MTLTIRASHRLATSLLAPKLEPRSFTPRLRVRQLVSQSLRRPRRVSVQVPPHRAHLFTSAATMNEGSSPFEYELIDDVERIEKYRPGGYHPVSVGDTLHDRYLIVDKLGFGGYSIVWLARNTRLNRYVAIKIAVADSPPQEAQVFRALSKSGPRPTVQQLSTPFVEQARTSLPLPLRRNLRPRSQPKTCMLRHVTGTMRSERGLLFAHLSHRCCPRIISITGPVR